jgi:hypothetical protein
MCYLEEHVDGGVPVVVKDVAAEGAVIRVKDEESVVQVPTVSPYCPLLKTRTRFNVAGAVLVPADEFRPVLWAKRTVVSCSVQEVPVLITVFSAFSRNMFWIVTPVTPWPAITV